MQGEEFPTHDLRGTYEESKGKYDNESFEGPRMSEALPTRNSINELSPGKYSTQLKGDD